MLKKRWKRKVFLLFSKYNNTIKIGHATCSERGHGFKKSVLLICVFLLGFITQHPHSLIIYTSNQNWRLACLLKSVTAVRKHVTATHFVSVLPHHQRCHLSTLLAPFPRSVAVWVGMGRAALAGSPCRAFGRTQRGVASRSTYMPPLWSAFFAAINYLLAHFSKVVFSAAIFHLFPLFLCILFHTCHGGILGWKTFISSNIGFCFTVLLLCLRQPNFLLPCTYLYCWVITRVNFLSCHSAIWHKVISLITGVIFQKLPGKADGQRCLPHVVQCSFIITAFFTPWHLGWTVDTIPQVEIYWQEEEIAKKKLRDCSLMLSKYRQKMIIFTWFKK